MKRIAEQLNNLNYYHQSQHGFRESRSTETAVKESINQISECKKFKYAVFIAADFSGAFDGIEWTHIIKNLKEAGLGNQFINATRELLINRLIVFDGGCVNITRLVKLVVLRGVQLVLNYG
jgi:retron-type reverse transcriptase